MPNYLTELSPDNNSHVYQIKDKEAAPIDLLKDTVGYVGKNIFEIPSSVVSKTTDGVVFTVNRNSDGQVTSINASRSTTASGDAYLLLHSAFVVEEDCIFNGCPAEGGNNKVTIVLYDGSNFFVDRGSGVAIPAGTYNINLRYYSSFDTAITAYPMIRKASITDATFEPYHESVEAEIEQVYADNGVLGAKNRLPYPYKETSKTDHSVEFTDNGDGTISFVGTPTDDNARFFFAEGLRIPEGKYSIVSNIKETGIQLIVQAYNNTTFVKNIIELENAERADFTVDYNGYNKLSVLLRISKNHAVSTSKTVTPMITLASDPDSTYQPYAMTNRELTEVHESELVTSNTVTTNKLVKIGKIVFCSVHLTGVTTAAWSGGIGTIPEGYRPKYGFRTVLANYGRTRIQIKADTGVIDSLDALENTDVAFGATWITS